MAPAALRAAVLLLLGLGVSAGAPPEPPEPGRAELTRVFEDFVTRYNKTYGSPGERRRRLGIFARALEDARRLQEAAGGAARFGPTRFSDLTEEEFRGRCTPLSGRRPPRAFLRRPPGKSPPRRCDWRKAGAVTPPGNQGFCCSCWAFAAVANVESLLFIHFQMLYNLSVQGVTTAELYPYQGRLGQCRWQHSRLLRIEGFSTLPADERELAAHVATQGPVTVLMNSKLLQSYRGGIITKHLVSHCDPNHLDHAVLIVGYGREKKIPYWIVKNSHGLDWGEKGYFRIYRGSNACGIAEIPITATVGHDGAGGTAQFAPCPA